MSVEAFNTADAAFDAAASAVLEALSAGLEEKGRASFAGAGGTTPGPVYRRLSGAPINWSKVTVTVTDERCVPETSPNSNARLLRETLLVGRAAEASFLSLTPSIDLTHVAPFDAVLLGMGEDGHFASLFPGSPALAKGLAPDGPTVVEAPAADPAPSTRRLSLTLSALAGARTAVLLILGEAKRRRLEAAEDLPVAHLIRTVSPRVLWAP